MKKSQSLLKYVLLYLPWLVSIFFLSNPIISYLIAWCGSFFIFYISFTNKIKDTSPDTPLTEKILRPLFLMQIIFAGYMCCTSIFYFLDNLGYEYATRVIYKNINAEQIKYISSCQLNYVLGHAALAHGLLLSYKSTYGSRYTVNSDNCPLLFLKIAIVSFPLSFIFNRISGLSQFSEQIKGLSFVSATLAFAVSIPTRKISITILAGSLLAINLAQNLLSGYKEPIIVSTLMLAIFLYPFYKRTVTFLFIPILFFLFIVLPTYVNTIRQLNWSGETNVKIAQTAALNKVRSDLSGQSIKKTNWNFLTGRLSEISMFIEFKKSMEKRHIRYGFKIVEQGLLSIIPRFIWPSKPITEKLAMERVYENGVISRKSNTSAKSPAVVDGYLSGGMLGVWITMFLYGVVAQSISNKSEKLFGGYLLGTGLIFTGLFGIFRRGNCFEFLFNSIFWGLVCMYLIFILLRRLHILYLFKETLPNRSRYTARTKYV